MMVKRTEYRLFPAPEGGYVGDTMPFVTEDGVLELYYLYDTDRNGQGYHPLFSRSSLLQFGVDECLFGASVQAISR